jgi:hypothetical protein
MKLIIKILMFLIIVFTFFNCALFERINSIKNGQKAISIAENYISNKYNQKMEYYNYSIVGFGGNFYDGDRNIYHGELIDGQFRFYDFYNIVFTENNNNEYLFNVLVSFDFSYIVDDYITDRFLYFSRTNFIPKIENIWNNAQASIAINKDDFYYAFNPPIELDEKMNPEDVKDYIDINISIYPNSVLTNANIKEEALKIFKTIEVIKAENYKPVYIEFSFKTDFDGKYMHIQLDNWNTIINIKEIEKILNDGLEELMK